MVSVSQSVTLVAGWLDHWLFVCLSGLLVSYHSVSQSGSVTDEYLV